MEPARSRAVVAAAISLSASAAGCGLGAGEGSDGEAGLRVTRDYGAEVLIEATESDPSASDTVLRVLDREADVQTRFGGGFVQSIDGVSGGESDGRKVDWFFYVNGVESSVGAADVPMRPGDRVWWDHRDWTDAMRVPAVVGSYPEPFAQAAVPAKDANPVRVECAGEKGTCEDVEASLSETGAEVAGVGFPARVGEALRVLVGPWAKLRAEPTASALSAGPGQSGVFAGFEREGDGWELSVLDAAADEAERLGSAGLIAALRPGESPPVWLVTGTDDRSVANAAGALSGARLRDSYAVAVTGDDVRPVPEAG
jgi:hypothetical protein